MYTSIFLALNKDDQIKFEKRLENQTIIDNLITYLKTINKTCNDIVIYLKSNVRTQNENKNTRENITTQIRQSTFSRNFFRTRNKHDLT